jgi:hypothetical protein
MSDTDVEIEVEDKKLPSKAVLVKAFKDYSLANADKSSAVGTIGSLVKNNETQHNIHRKAFKDTAALEKMDETKRSEYLTHLFHYMSAMDLGIHADLFEDQRAKELAAMTMSDADRALLEAAETETVQ